MLQAITTGEYKKLRDHRSEVPEGLAAVIAKAMQVAPANRYSDLHAFGAAIRPWASPQSRLIWEAHFTSSAPTRQNPQMSIAIQAPTNHAEDPKAVAIDDATVDRTLPPFGSPHATNTTVPSRRNPQVSVPVGTKELPMLSGDLSLATTALQDPNNPPSASIEIDFQDPTAPPRTESSDTPLNTTSRRVRRPLSSTLRRPMVIIFLATVALTVVTVFALFLSRSKPTPTDSHAPPADLFVRPTPALLAPVAPASAVSPKLSPPAATAAATEVGTSQPAPPERPRPLHKHHKLPVDKNGIPIPSD